MKEDEKIIKESAEGLGKGRKRKKEEREDGKEDEGLKVRVLCR